MKGFLLSIFYTSKKTLISYFIVSIVVTVIFSFLNPLMTCFMPMVFLLSPITDNIKHEKDSKWMYYVSVFPKGRNIYVNSYYVAFLSLILTGLLVGLIFTAIFTQNISMMLLSACIGIGAVGTYSIVFPLTFKFGSENSNVILTTSSIILILSFFVVLYGLLMPNMMDSDSFATAIATFHNVIVSIGYALFGLIILAITYFLSMKTFKKQDL